MGRGLLIELDEVAESGRPVLWIDARRGPDYRRGHIPGAIHLDTFEYTNERTDPEGRARMEADWWEMFRAAGLTAGDCVVFYDEGTENRAGRPAFMLRYLGHDDVHLLHGGMAAWLDAGRPLSKVATVREPAPAGGLPRRARTEMIATVDDVAAALKDGSVLLDVRGLSEYTGQRRPQRNPRVGRIPGAVHVAWVDLLEQRQGFPHQVGTPRFREFLLSRFRPSADLLRLLAERGVRPEQDVILYCQKSHRASTVYAGLEKLGFGRLRIYPGSFREWSRRKDLPVEREPAGNAARGSRPAAR